MKIVIEIYGGAVSGVYHVREKRDGKAPIILPEVVIADLDVAKVGEGGGIELVTVQPLKEATTETRQMLRKGTR